MSSTSTSGSQNAAATSKATVAVPARRVAQVIRLKPECVEAYKECHANAWPEVLKQIEDCGIRDYSIYLDSATSTLFATFKYIGSDWEADMAKMKGNAVVRKWWEMTDAMQESFVEGATGSTGEKGWWKDLEEVFHTE